MDTVHRSTAPRAPIRIISNCFSLNSAPKNAFLYSLSFTPEITNEEHYLRSRVLGTGRVEIQRHIGKFWMAGINLIAHQNKEVAFLVSLHHENQSYEVAIACVGKLTPDHSDPYKVYLNVILKEDIRKLGLRQLTRLPKYFDPNATVVIPEHGLTIWTGFTAQFGHHMRQVLLTVDFSSKIIRNETILGLINGKRNNNRNNYRAAIEELLVGTSVMATYGRNVCYHVDAVLWDESPMSTFSRNGEPISYIDYMQSTYHIQVTDAAQPLLYSTSNRGTREFRLIPELFWPIGLTDEMRADFRCMEKIANTTRLPPHIRHQKVHDLMTSVTRNSVLDVNPNNIEFEGYQLPLEGVIAGNGQKIKITEKSNFNLRGQMYEAGTINSIIVLSTERDTNARETMIQSIYEMGRTLGLTIGNVFGVSFEMNNINSRLQQLKNPPKGHESPDIAVFILPPPSHLYKVIKEACCKDIGILSQCIKGKNFNNPKRIRSILEGTVRQIAHKTGSISWIVPKVDKIPAKTMVVGIDVYHDTKRGGARSVVGFNASIHPSFTKYFNAVKIQNRSREEIVQGISELFQQSLETFFIETKRKFLPEMIVVYRDGVGDSQISAVKELEVEAMKSVIRSFNNYNPDLYYVIVNKETNIQLFTRANNRIVNLPPGSVADYEITPDNRSFYMISHAVTQGMARPTLYRVIERPGNALPIDTIARLTLKLCYLYFNWSGGIKIPAPVMHAHKIAFVVGQNLHSEYSKKLSTKLWFL